MNDVEVSETIEQLAERLGRRIDRLECRVATLERSPQSLPQSPAAFAAAAPAPEAIPLLPEGSGLFSVLGRAMLGIAGAYILRALAESTALPRTAVAAIALLYAFLWLIPATRAPAKAWWAALIWTATSALILLPMVWELTLRFHLVPDAVAAGLLAFFVLLASTLAWNHHFAEIAWVTNAASALAALFLSVATRDLVPFLAALFLIAATGEMAAARHRTLRVRPLVAAVLNVALFALIWIRSSPAHDEYQPIGAALLLALSLIPLLIYAASATAQTLLLRRRISFFEAAQTLIAFSFAAWAVLVFGPGRGTALLGAACLLAAAAGYIAVFRCFDPAKTRRNYHVYATGSLALLLAGSILALPPSGAALLCSTLAVIAAALGARLPRLTLQAHSLALIATAILVSGLLAWQGQILGGPFPMGPGRAIAIVSILAILTWVAVVSRQHPIPGWTPRVTHLLLAAFAASAAVSLLVWMAVRLTATTITPGSEHIAVIRTLIACLAALALAAGASRWQRNELGWLAWAALALTALKLLLEDLRHGHLAWTAASISLYAVTLLLVPRLLRPRPPEAPQPTA